MLQATTSSINFHGASQMNNKYTLFPFNAVKPGTKIAIYGAGEIFFSFKKQIESLDYCDIAWIIDQKYDSSHCNEVMTHDSIIRVPPQAMEWEHADYVIIASIAFANEIESTILKYKGNLNNIIKITERNIIDESFYSNEYWEKRYSSGLNSGSGSYNHLAKFKANIINEFVIKNNIKNIIELGCGDGNQLKLANYQQYLGFDISAAAVKLCKEKFSLDNTKDFRLVSEYNNECAELALSLDVIFHLTKDEEYKDYMDRLFSSASKYVIIYSSNSDLNNGEISEPIAHVKHRKFSTFIDKYYPTWKLTAQIDNKYAYNGNNELTTFSDFYIYKNNK